MFDFDHAGYERELKKLVRKIRKLADVLTGDTMKPALVVGALEILNEMKDLAPKLRGTLTRSLHIGDNTGVSDGFGSGEGADEYGNIGGQKVSVDRVEILAGTNLVYAKIQEFGGTIEAKNAPYLVFEGSDGGMVRVKSVDIPAKPYLRPAFDTRKGAAEREFRLEMLNQLRRAAK